MGYVKFALIFWLTVDGPEPLKENDLRTASLIIEVFGEDLVSLLT